MAKLRPVSEQEAAQVPADEPVKVVVPPAGQAEVKTEQAPPPSEVKEGSQQEPAVDDGLETLRRQLDESNRIAEHNRQVAELQAKRAREMEQYYGQAYYAWQNAQSGQQRAEYDGLLNALGQAQAEADAAKNDIRSAYNNNDPEALVEAQDRLATAKARVVALEDGKLAVEAQMQQAQAAAEYAAQQGRQPRQQRQRQPQTVDEAINRMPNLLPQERDWLRQHPDALTDPAKSAGLTHFYYESQRRNIQRGSQAYFNLLEEGLGYKQSRQEAEDDDDRSARVSVQAPPSRESVSMGTGESHTTVTLTPEEREIAKISGLTDTEYARNKLRLRAEKKSGRYSEAR